MANHSLSMCNGPNPNKLGDTRVATAIITISVILTILNIFVNVILIYALKGTDQLKSVSYRLIAFLSFSDICFGLMLQALVSIHLGVLRDIESCALKLSVQFLTYSFSHISAFMLVIVAFDRWLHMKYLNKYSTLMNCKRASLTIIANVFFSLMSASGSVLANIYNKFFIFKTIFVVIGVNIFAFIYIAYICTFRCVTKQGRLIKRKRNQDNTSAFPKISTGISRKSQMRDMKLAKTMLFILTSLTICYAPYFGVALYWSYLRYYRLKATGLSLYAAVWYCLLLVYFNSSLNAVLFIRRNQRVYRLLKRKIGIASSSRVSSEQHQTISGGIAVVEI